MNNLINDYLEIDIEEYLGNKEEKDNQINLFDQIGSNDQELEKQEYEIEKKKSNINVVAIKNIKEITKEKLENINATKLFNEIDMPTVEVLANMQWNGMYVDEKELSEFGKELTDKLEVITKIIYEMAGEEFNINSTKQLGEILFEKMKLPVIKKTKSGYSTDVDVLEKLRKEDPIIEQIIEYRQLIKPM